jgi:acyl-CoA thioesterase II
MSASVPTLPQMLSLEERLRLEPAGEDRFHALLPGFGAVTLGCATLAAARTTELALHSLHAYFLRPTPADRTALLRVARVRDGRRFATRRVEVFDGDKLCFELLASFAGASTGPEYEEAALPPMLPAPEELPDEAQVIAEEGLDLMKPGFLGGPIEMRFVAGSPWRASDVSLYRAWVRPREPLPADPAFHAAGFAFLADMHSHVPAARRLGYHFEPFGFTSLDQVVWLHRTEPWTDWLLLTSVSEIGSGGRAFGRRTLHARDGRLIASMAQEQFVSFAASEATR